MRIGILSIQGAFIEHANMLDLLNIEHFEIRQKKDLTTYFDGLILPGGESTVMGKLLHELDLFDELNCLIKNGLPVLGTCAGLILLAQNLTNHNGITHFSTMPITVKRNAYGRQLGSFQAFAEFHGIGEIPMTFIRAPYIESVENGTEVLALVDGNIVAARYKNQLGVTFHPELTKDTSLHNYFIHMVQEDNKRIKCQ